MTRSNWSEALDFFLMGACVAGLFVVVYVFADWFQPIVERIS